MTNLLLLTLPLRLGCELFHYCMGGHLAHEEMWFGYPYDAAWLGVMLFATVRARHTRMPNYKWLMGAVVMDCASMAVGIPLPFVTSVLTGWVAVSVRRELREPAQPGRATGYGGAHQASDAGRDERR